MYREKIQQPILVNNPIGSDLCDSEEFDFIESQMMKVGSLNHGDVKWIEAEEMIISLLAERSKDIRLLSYLLQCLQYNATPQRALLSIQILTDFLAAYWLTAYPNSGSGKALKVKFFQQMMQRTEKMLIQMDASLRVELANAGMMTALDALITQVRVNDLPAQVIEDIQGSWAIKQSQAIEETDIKKVNTPSWQALSNPRLSSLELYSGSDSKTQNALMAVADFIWDANENKNIAVRLRRYALWMTITSLPERDEQQASLLMPVCSDRVSEYKNEMIQSPSFLLWQRIEQSITMSPFWIEGHYLSYQLALLLGQTMSANAIREETQQFVARLEGIETCRFSGGKLFIPEAVGIWLADIPSIDAAGSDARGWQHEREQALLLANENGLPAALTMLNEGLANALEPRDHFYWRLLSAEIMEEQKLPMLALQGYQTLLKEAENITLFDWEPSLIKRLKHFANAD